MGDLISRSALLRNKTRMTEYDETGCGVHVIVVRADDIANAPAVDAEPVRHGKWGECHITGYDGLHAVYTRPCSECGHEARFSTRYCPVCGAKMDAEVNP